VVYLVPGKASWRIDWKERETTYVPVVERTSILSL